MSHHDNQPPQSGAGDYPGPGPYPPAPGDQYPAGFPAGNDPTRGYPSGGYPQQGPMGGFPPPPDPTAAFPRPDPTGAYPPARSTGYPTGGYPQQGPAGYPTGGYPQQGPAGYGSGGHGWPGSGAYPRDPYPGTDQRRPRPSSPGIAILVIIIVISIAGTAVLLLMRDRNESASPGPSFSASQGNDTVPPSSPLPTAIAAGQARSIDQLLIESELGRDLLSAATDQISVCIVNSATYANINGAIQNRSSLISRLDAVAVDALPDGALLKAELRAAFSASYDADVAYLNWVDAAGQRCPSTSDPAYAAVVEANARATGAKTVFITRWNPIAQRYGLPTRSASDI